uniref:Uncharacterized protein n=2 Tax=Meloidogyne TaxID=189290 RepID=A0A915P402_9BILA
MKSKNKKLPLELLVDIFEATDSTILEFTKKVFFNNDKPLMLKQKEFEKLWINYVNKLLTSSSIVYIFVGIIFKRRWLLICEEREKVQLHERLMEENKELLNVLKEFIKREERRRENVFKEKIEEEYGEFKTRIFKRRKSEGDKDE